MIAIKDIKMPNGCQRCRFFRKHNFGNGLDYSYSCDLGATEFPMPWIRQMEERASDCPLIEIEQSEDKVTISFDKGVLKHSEKDYVVYKKDWLRKHFAMEVAIMTGYERYNGEHEKLEKIKQIIKQHDNDSLPQNYWYIYKIKEVLKKE